MRRRGYRTGHRSRRTRSKKAGGMAVSDVRRAGQNLHRAVGLLLKVRDPLDEAIRVTRGTRTERLLWEADVDLVRLHRAILTLANTIRTWTE